MLKTFFGFVCKVGRVGRCKVNRTWQALSQNAKPTLRAMRGPQECFKVLKGLLSLPGKCVKDKRASNKDKVGIGKKAGRLMLPSVRV